jgi:nucleotide-binding universal stress UspA family protein
MEDRGKIVVGVDGSKASVHALRIAVRLAPVLNAEVYAVACWEFPMMGVGEEGYVPPDFETIEAAERQRLAEAVASALGTELPDGFHQGLVHGPARTKLLEAGAGADMMIVGRRGHGGLFGMHLGSVSSACVSHAECPVLVVPAEEAETQVRRRLWKGSKA